VSFVLVAALAVGGAWWVRAGRGSSGGAAAPRAPIASREASDDGGPTPAISVVRAPQAGAPVDSDGPAGAEPPSSLRDTDVDGALAVGAAGELVVGPGVRRFFDYFLSATGEEPEASLRARARAAMAARLRPPALGQAEALFDRYLAYRREGAVRLNGAGQGGLERRYEELRDFRRSWFGPRVADALFSDQDAAARAALERRRVLADEALPPDERRRRLDAIDAALPPDERRARAEALAPLEAFERERALREQGASEQAVRRSRVDAFGEDGARRLEDLDRERAAWRGRYEAYRAERRAIEADGALDAAARERAVEALRARSFAPNERVRAKALDGIEGAGGTPP
jgi:lipase chaperone LimK